MKPYSALWDSRHLRTISMSKSEPTGLECRQLSSQVGLRH